MRLSKSTTVSLEVTGWCCLVFNPTRCGQRLTILSPSYRVKLLGKIFQEGSFPDILLRNPILTRLAACNGPAFAARCSWPAPVDLDAALPNHAVRLRRQYRHPGALDDLANILRAAMTPPRGEAQRLASPGSPPHGARFPPARTRSGSRLVLPKPAYSARGALAKC
jgi:hypothetical protein